VGWVTDTYGPRVGFAAGGAVAALAAIGVGVMLARVGDLRVKIDLRRGRPHVTFVPKERLATAA
ncbi:MFS transporter, partial [Streptomyces niveus]